MFRNISRSALYTAIRLLSLVALVFASALAVDYYFNANTFCNAGASCEVVAKSDFGQKYGIFLPTLGLLAYSFFFLTSFFFTKTKRTLFGKSLSTFWLPLAVICCAVGAFLFVIIQATQIYAFCYLCMGIDTSAMLMVIPAVLLMRNRNTSEEKHASFFHPILWIGLYVLAAAGPLTWGTFQPAAVESTAPQYIQSFYKPGKINVVEISSFDCPHCRQLHPEFSKLIAEYGDKINFTRLTIPLGRNKEACVAYYCSELQKKQNAFAECMFENPSKDPDEILAHAKHCSIDESSFKSCLADPASLKAIDEQLKNIQSINFQGAPTVWIENTEIIGYNAAKGMTPYRDAIEQRKQSLHTKYPLAFIATLAVVAILLLTGGFLTMRRHRREDDDRPSKLENDNDAKVEERSSDENASGEKANDAEEKRQDANDKESETPSKESTAESSN